MRAGAGTGEAAGAPIDSRRRLAYGLEPMRALKITLVTGVILAAGYVGAGLLVAWLAGLNPLMIPFTAILLGALFVGGEQLQSVLGLPSTISLILEGALLFGLFTGQTLASFTVTVGGRSREAA